MAAVLRAATVGVMGGKMAAMLGGGGWWPCWDYGGRVVGRNMAAVLGQPSWEW